MLHKVFLPCSAKVLGTEGLGGWDWQGHTCVKIFPELMWSSVQNLVEIGRAVRAWKRDIGTSSLFYIDRLPRHNLKSFT